MVLWFGKRAKARPVPDGQFEKRRCPECDKTTVFRECTVNKQYTAYVVVKLWSSEATAFACDACGAVMDLEETLDPELTAREQKRLKKAEEKKAQEAAAERERQRKRFEAEELRKEQAVDDELTEMKKRLGLD